MKLRRLLPLACLVAVLAGAEDVQAEPPLKASQLHEICLAWHLEPGSNAAESCAAYIRGFLDGAANIDDRTASSPDRTESFVARARRTRLGRTHLGSPPYCIDQSVVLTQVIDHLLLYCERRQLDGAMRASTLLAQVLGEFYPC